MEFTITMTGTAPLLMHNIRLADPLDTFAKALKRVTSKRTKTEDDHEEMARTEFYGGLYLDPDVGPFVPGENVQKCLIEGARINKLGKSVERGLFIHTDVNPLAYTGPRDADGLWKNENFRHRAAVRVGTSRTMRCRPMFRQWRCEARGILDTSQLNLDDLRSIADNAGAMIGLGDRRPRFGRFTCEIAAA
jgi:hypothetical protein